MKYALTENGNVKVKDGKIILIGDDGKEFDFDAISARDTIGNLHKEAAEHRKKASERSKALEAFGDIDPVAAKEALATVASMSDSHKMEVDKLKATLNQTWQEKLEAAQKESGELTKKLYNATVTAKFATSEAVKQTVLTPDIAAKVFGDHFAIDGTAKDSAGNTIYSRERPGEPASFDEALLAIISQYPGKDHILRGSGADGTGGSGGNRNSSNTLAKFYDKKSGEYSLTEQSKIANTNPTLHQQLSSTFKS